MPTKEELEQLIAIASQPAPSKEFKDLSSIDAWILACDIKPGNERLIPTVVYVAYRRWAKHPMNGHDFFKLLRKRFTPKRGNRTSDKGAHWVYSLNPEPFYTVPRDMDVLRSELSKANRAKYEEKDPYSKKKR